MKYYKSVTLGCKVNTYESEFVSSLLQNHGYEINNFDEVCDIYIINTCTVTNTSDVKLLNCYVETDSSNSISKRKTASKLLISNTQIINSHADPGGLIYNSSFDASNIVTINSYFKNYSTYIYNNTNGVVLNSYLDDELIEEE